MALARMIKREEVRLGQRDWGAEFADLVKGIPSKPPPGQGFYGGGAPVQPATQSRRRWPEAGPTPQGRPVPRSGAKRAKHPDHAPVVAQAAGFCERCGDAYAKQEEVIFNVRTRTILHKECAEARSPRPS